MIRRRNSPAAPPKAITASHGATGLALAKARGTLVRSEWIRAGDVVPSKLLAAAWGLTAAGLAQAVKRRELFAIKIANRNYYLAEFLELGRTDVAAVCREISCLTPEEQFVFWQRKHGALGGESILQVLKSNEEGAQLRKVVEFARNATSQLRAPTSAPSERPSRRNTMELDSLAKETFETADEAARWLRRPHPMLDGDTPLERARSIKGAERVRDILLSIKYGNVI